VPCPHGRTGIPAPLFHIRSCRASNHYVAEGRPARQRHDDMQSSSSRRSRHLPTELSSSAWQRSHLALRWPTRKSFRYRRRIDNGWVITCGGGHDAHRVAVSWSVRRSLRAIRCLDSLPPVLLFRCADPAVPALYQELASNSPALSARLAVGCGYRAVKTSELLFIGLLAGVMSNRCTMRQPAGLRASRTRSCRGPCHCFTAILRGKWTV